MFTFLTYLVGATSTLCVIATYICVHKFPIMFYPMIPVELPNGGPHMKKFIVHIQFGENMPETQVPIMAKDLDEANEWADKTYAEQGIEVTRVRPAL